LAHDRELRHRIDMSTARDRKRQIQGNFCENEFQPSRQLRSGQCEMRQPIHHVSFWHSAVNFRDDARRRDVLLGYAPHALPILLVAAGLQWKGKKGQATAMKAV
jgi:hypothetical protein